MMTDAIRKWLLAEGAIGFLLWMVLYSRKGASWWMFAACFLLPDLSMFGYMRFGCMRNPQLGSSCYNLVHSYVGPALLAAVSLGRWPTGVAAALIWASHIGFDRMLGYGLKSPTNFNDTHLTFSGRNRI